MSRSLMRLACALHLALSTLSAAAGLSPSLDPRHNGHTTCKAIPGTPGWPSAETWARLNESVDGRLLQPSPPGAVCHPGQPTYNATACVAVQAAWPTYEFHQADPVSTDWNQFNNDTCLPLEGYPCSGQGYPVFVINATTARHVKLGVEFARKHNIRLVIKSSGHDFVGRSNAPNSLSIWVHHLKGLKTHSSFRPKHCEVTIDGPAVTVGGGVQMIELYTALDAINQTVVGGGGKTVSVGGYLTGGGHGLLSARYGLAADQVLEMEVVTPTGDIVTANECQNKDLFWAMRGGGGSTFGIVTSVTMKTFPTPQLVQLNLAIATTDLSNPRRTFDMVAYVLSQFPSLGDQGFAGYSYFFSAYPNPLDGGATTAQGLFLAGVLPDSTPEALHPLFDSILAHVNATWPGYQLLFSPKAFPSFYAWYQENYDQSPAGLDTYVGSRLLDAAALTGNLTRSADAFARFANGSLGTAYLVSGKGVHEARPRGGGNAVVPAWRKAYVHATCPELFPPVDPAAEAAARKRLTARVAALRELAPDSGAYVNEANPFEPDWQREFWGGNYDRLLRIKRAVDPDDVLWCTPCVGNERWQQVGNRLCRVK
ncbi:hypothetical protein VTK56DRAFT_2256 [Thermocarpiscus australiensis]